MSQKYNQLTDIQRYQIEAYLKVGMSKQFIAKEIGVHRSTIYREINRNKTKWKGYTAKRACIVSETRKKRYLKNRKFNREKMNLIRKYLEQEQWSPEQIKGHCDKQGIEMVSTERIYQFIRKDRVYGGDLYKQLRHKLKHRKRPIGKTDNIKDKTSIDQRPDIINRRGRFGDWEVDTIVGRNNRDAIATIVERSTGFFMMKKLDKGRNAIGLSKQLIDMLIPYKEHILSITSDNGKEFAEHKQIAEKLQAKYYFAHPYSSWERGLNEYTNKLIRQYIPKKTSFSNLTDEQIAQIQYKINRRPRKKLNFQTPKHLFFNLVT